MVGFYSNLVIIAAINAEMPFCLPKMEEELSRVDAAENTFP
jgi:hypothetical protein